MADIRNKNELKHRIDVFLHELSSEEYKINEEYCKETMRMMADFIGMVNQRIDQKDKKISNLKKDLKQYRDAEEQGLLLRLPSEEAYSSSGDTVYYIFDYEIAECINCGVSMDFEGKLWIALACDEYIFPYRSPIAEIDTDPTDWCMNTTTVMIDEWGKTVFLTEAEAQRALEGMK